jgi:hypothetical protein
VRGGEPELLGTIPDEAEATAELMPPFVLLWERMSAHFSHGAIGFTELHVSLILFRGDTALGDTPCYADDHC